MNVDFTPDQEAKLEAEEDVLELVHAGVGEELSKIASREGVNTEQLVKDAALRLLKDDALFRAGVRKGIEQANRGQFVEEEEMDARVRRMLQP